MEQIANIYIPIQEELVVYQKLFDSALDSPNSLLKSVLEYLTQKNGKMMRPILVMLIGKLFGRVNDSTLHAAVALELLHTASLVHDDVVDESNERRGQRSVNAVFNNKVAVLTGDFLLATALVEGTLTANQCILNKISTLGQVLAEGELLQLSNIPSQNFSESVYLDIISMKTAALFSTCTEVAAISVGASVEECEFAQQFGKYIGLCFQIKDDIFDYYADANLGKPTGNDMLEGKLTLPALYALRNADERMQQMAFRVKEGTASADEIALLVDYTKVNGGIEYAMQMIEQYRSAAIELLNPLPDSDVKQALKAYLSYVVERNK